MKQNYMDVLNTNNTSESQKNLIYFMQWLERVKIEVDARKNWEKSVKNQKNKVRQFNIADKRRIMELLLWKEDILTKVLVKILRKLKIKDIEKSLQRKNKESKYRNLSSGHTSSSVGRNRLYQRTANQIDEFTNPDNKGVMSFNGSNSIDEKHRYNSHKQNFNKNYVQYEASPPVNVLNKELRE